jgi:hypothetical protein
MGRYRPLSEYKAKVGLTIIFEQPIEQSIADESENLTA